MAATTFKDVLRLVKSGIIIGNSFHYMIGVLLVVPVGWGEWSFALYGLSATILLIASACMINNWFDKDIDKNMTRTATRLTARGDISSSALFSIAGAAAAVAMVILYTLVNPLTALLGFVAWFSYSFIYTPSKTRTAWSTVIGTIPGALPAVAGYTAVSGQMTATAWWLFALIVAWQLPHFYAISVYRKREYLAAGVPVLAALASARQMRVVIVATTILYLAVAVFSVFVSVSVIAAILLIIIALIWTIRMQSYDAGRHELWARDVFKYSMYVSIGMLLVAAVHFAISS